MNIQGTCLIEPKAAWSIALTAKEIKAIAQGISPLLIRPEKLTYFRPEYK